MKKKYKLAFNIVTAAIIVFVCAAVIIGLAKGVFSSKDTFTQFVRSAGIFAPAVFVLLETLTVVVLVLPCALGYPVSAAAFGPFWGFVLNAISTILGSIIIFAIVRKWGKPLVEAIVEKKHFDKYEKFIGHTKAFERILITAFLLPFFPDNVLSYLAGLTKITFKRFVIITILFKPWIMIFYTYGSDYFIERFSHLWNFAQSAASFFAA